MEEVKMDYDYIQLQTLYYHSMVQVMTNVFFGIIVFMVIRRMLRNKKVFRLLSIAVLIVPFSIMAISLSILDYVRH
jgi:hypothetical protein